MNNYAVGFKTGEVRIMNASDPMWLMTELNQNGQRNNIAFIIDERCYVAATKYLQTGEKINEGC